ncbi:MAG: HAD hydrolase-like protein, partial [Candidatus Paralactobacillus gallistercoris]|nr:HAD hydrolase-like protein [Candidatus Paralactobacillus gallistercoris]
DEMHLQNHLADVMMVGDRRDDVAGARDNHIDAMGVTYGFGTARELKDAGARVIATSPADVADWLLRH